MAASSLQEKSDSHENGPAEQAMNRPTVINSQCRIDKATLAITPFYPYGAGT
ncbi:MAG: hypothetical protein HQL64_04925 [Magnetococcales bacterium]|nr:hypothetical protein [Magnetococcales bacterium]